MTGRRISVQLPRVITPEARESARRSIAAKKDPPLVVWGRMVHASKHISDQLRHLPAATHDYHGTLRTVYSAALSLQQDALRLIHELDIEEGGER